ncbi:hypothetical protein BKA69DRAFT_1179116 [Paraphysoderma sedebokerense]|nr:hypothetical protein BKA69DRAFT_1179116 [Paraphysoderma sedebokerense]
MSSNQQSLIEQVVLKLDLSDTVAKKAKEYERLAHAKRLDLPYGALQSACIDLACKQTNISRSQLIKLCSTTTKSHQDAVARLQSRLNLSNEFNVNSLIAKSGADIALSRSVHEVLDLFRRELNGGNEGNEIKAAAFVVCADALGLRADRREIANQAKVTLSILTKAINKYKDVCKKYLDRLSENTSRTQNKRGKKRKAISDDSEVDRNRSSPDTKTAPEDDVTPKRQRTGDGVFISRSAQSARRTTTDSQTPYSLLKKNLHRPAVSSPLSQFTSTPGSTNSTGRTSRRTGKLPNSIDELKKTVLVKNKDTSSEVDFVLVHEESTNIRLNDSGNLRKDIDENLIATSDDAVASLYGSVTSIDRSAGAYRKRMDAARRFQQTSEDANELLSRDLERVGERSGVRSVGGIAMMTPATTLTLSFTSFLVPGFPAI